ncbi:MAG: choice-of-anchor L domain-containing protein [Myxococcales bacterium]|nr:choice-of-anchor L domain-containing protein [Myxococcales bacterium]
MNKSVAIWVAVALAGAGLAAACSAGSNNGGGGNDTEGTGASGGASGQTTVTTGQGGSASSFGNQTSTGSGQPGCDAGPDEDKDMDGFTINGGDCNDCDANVNPAAIEVIAEDGQGGGGGMMEPADEDCDGEIDNVPTPCDTGIPLNTTDPFDGARAVELCKSSAGDDDWGVVSAQWVRANGGASSQPVEQFGVLPNFGTNVAPRAGESLLGLSSGRARTPGQPGFCGTQTCTSSAGTAPPGFPQLVCNASPNINDDIGLEVTLRAPSNATGYQFDFRFYSFEFAEWVCTSYNDQFIALANPAPMGSINGNISFDSMNNPVSVNLGFFDTCDTCSDWAAFCNTGCPPMPNPCCPAGATDLQGSGFELDAGATAWLQTTAPIGPLETFSLRFAIWDAGDQALDSSVIVDNFRWIANGGTVNVGTNPVPE